MYRFVAITLFLLYSAQLVAQVKASSPVKRTGYTASIRHITIKDGLPTDVLSNGLQGRDGFIWLASRDGLVRYDGQDFVTFSKESHGLSSSNVVSIEQISDDWLWLICGIHSFDNNRGGKLNLFNTKTHEVVLLEEQYDQIKDVTFHHIRSYNDTALVLFSNFDFCYYTFTQKQGFKQLDLCSESFNNFIISPDNLIWTAEGISGDILIRAFTFNGEVVEKHELNLNAFSELKLIGFSENGRPLGYYGGDQQTTLVELDKKGDLSPLFSRNGYAALSFSCQFEDGGEILIRDLKNGIYILNEGEKPECVLDSLASSKIPPGEWRFEVFKGKGGSYWLTHSDGLYEIEIKKDRFKKFLTDKNDELKHQIRGIWKAENGNLYVASERQGIVCIEEDGSEKQLVQGDYLCIYGDSANIYLGSSRIEVFDQNQLLKYRSNKLKINGVWSIFQEGPNSWWLGGESGVLHGQDYTGEFKNLYDQIYGQGPLHSTTYQIFKQKAEIWLVSSSGLYAYNANNHSIKRVMAKSKDGQTELLKDVHHVLCDGEIWWIATNGNGLVRWDRKNNTFDQWRTKDGLSSDVIYACLDDDQGNLWISSNFGIMRFNKQMERVTTYTEEDGLPHHEFNRISWHQDEDGIIYFGGLDGLVGFDPKHFIEDQTDYHADLQITSFFQFNERKKMFEDLSTEVQVSHKIIMHPYSSFFTLNFKLLDFKEDKKQYAYMLAGYDKDWHYLPTNSLQLGVLPYGEYTLMVKGQNQEGQWSSSVLLIDIQVLKPFYLKLWFIILGFLVLVGSITGIITWRTWKLNKDRKRLEKTVQEQTRKLRDSLKETEQEKERSDELLLNILPAEIAAELKEKGKAEARNYEMVSLIFTDFKEFTEISERMNAIELVDEINYCFRGFDAICEKNEVEKIKTIGDAYMAAVGLSIQTPQTAKIAVLTALDMQVFIKQRKAERESRGEVAFDMRIGIHSGPVVAGIVGSKKFQYDLWGDTVNTASRIEQAGEVGKVNISQSTYNLLQKDPDFVFEPRGKIEVKGKGEMEMWFVEKAKRHPN